MKRDFLVSPAAVVDTAEIHRSVVGAGVEVGRNAHVSNSILLPGSTIGENAIVRNAIVDEHAVVHDGDAIGLDTLSDRCRHYVVTQSGIVVVSGGDAPDAGATGLTRQSRTDADAPIGDANGLILVADGNAEYLDWARSVLETAGYSVLTTQSAARLMALVVRYRPVIRVAISGALSVDGESGTCARVLLDNLPNVPVILRGGAAELPPGDSQAPFGVLSYPASAVELAVMVGEARSWGRTRTAFA
jgi:carbonic anhydrase/acetyltransferase-like protein (isoleucine patch superfamily)